MNATSARREWEKMMGKEMTHEEFVMFSWGYSHCLYDYVNQEKAE